jgi:hypothetical protein
MSWRWRRIHGRRPAADPVSRQAACHLDFQLAAFTSLWTLLAGTAVVSGWLEVHEALKLHTYRVVSGPVENFRPMPHEGHSEESFTVQGISFRYSDFEITPGYHKTETYGGAIHKTSNLRIGYICRSSDADCSDPLIVRLEVLTRPASPADSQRTAAGMRPMAEADLRRLLSDVEIGPRCCDMAEGFYRDGRYARYGYGVQRGTYSIRGNIACSRLAKDQVRCTAFYADAGGNPWFDVQGFPDMQPVDPRPMVDP